MSKKAENRRFVQADREALITLGAYALYFLWWYATAYVLGDGSPQSYSRVMGMPSWFFYSCIVGYPLITLFLWGLMRLFFQNMPLNDGGEEEDGQEGEYAAGEEVPCVPPSCKTGKRGAKHE